MINQIFIFENGVGVFNEDGKQLPHLQGKWEERFNQVLGLSGPETLIFDQRALRVL